MSMGKRKKGEVIYFPDKEQIEPRLSEPQSMARFFALVFFSGRWGWNLKSDFGPAVEHGKTSNK